MPREPFQEGISHWGIKVPVEEDRVYHGLVSPKKQDNVNSPAHYSLNHKGIECIDAIEAALTKEEFVGYIKGNIIKYIWRERYKGKSLEDVKKASWYNTKLIKLLGGLENASL